MVFAASFRSMRSAMLALLPVAAHAQHCGAVQGQWLLDPRASQLAAGLSFNPYYRVEQIALTIAAAAGAGLRETWRFDGPHIHETVAYSFNVDGTTQPTRATALLDSVPVDIVPQWQNCTLLIDARSLLFGVDVWTHNVYVLDTAGGRLTILQTGRSTIGRSERALVFDRTGRKP